MNVSNGLPMSSSDTTFGDNYFQKKHTKHDCTYCRAAKFCLPALCMLNEKPYSPNDLIERRRIFKQHEHLIRKSEPQKYLYAIHSGCCKGYYVDSAGREHVSSFYYPGDIMGLESIFFGKFLIDIIALDTSDICYISLAKFKTFQWQSQEAREQLLNIFSQQLWQSYSMHGVYSAQELVIQFLLNLSLHSKALGESETKLKLSMGRHDIGNFLGLSSETVSRVITRLKTNKLIEVERNYIKLCNLARLNELATNSDV